MVEDQGSDLVCNLTRAPQSMAPGYGDLKSLDLLTAGKRGFY